MRNLGPVSAVSVRPVLQLLHAMNCLVCVKIKIAPGIEHWSI